MKLNFYKIGYYVFLGVEGLVLLCLAPLFFLGVLTEKTRNKLMSKVDEDEKKG